MINSIDDILNKIEVISIEISKPTHDVAAIKEIRLDILLLIENAINYFISQDGFDTWEKDSIASAISDFNWNMSRPHHGVFMLTSCLVSIDISCTEKAMRSLDYLHNEKRATEINKLSAHDFLNTVYGLRKTVLSTME